MTEKSSYKKIFKSAGVFGGVKLFQIIATIIRSKIVAIYLGASGMGISGILVSSSAMVQSVSELGLNFSSVREISQSLEHSDESKLKRIISIFLRLILFSSIFGMFLLIIFSPILSKIAFGNHDYIWSFIILSLLVFFNTFSGGLQSILQGTRKLKSIAKATIIGTALSIFISLPIYIYYGINGIVPALVISSFLTFIINYYFTREKIVLGEKINHKVIIEEGKDMLQLGFTMVFVNLLSTLVPFLINAFIKNKGSLSDVGLYQAGLSLTTQYISLVFAAMTVDYFPRLSEVNRDNLKVKQFANQQSEIMLLIIIPLLIGLIIIAPILIKILLTSQFIIISNFVRLMSIGLFFQAASYSMGLISFAKGDKNTFIKLSVIGNISWLLFSIVGYNFNGLSGIALFYIFHSIFCFLLVYFTIAKRYNYAMSKSFFKLLALGATLLFTVYILNTIWVNTLTYSFSFLLLTLIFIYFFSILNKKTGFLEDFTINKKLIK